jgi:hypothetical protein
MTRRDWWLGILVIVVALIIQTLVFVGVMRTEHAVRFRPLVATSSMVGH